MVVERLLMEGQMNAVKQKARNPSEERETSSILYNMQSSRASPECLGELNTQHSDVHGLICYLLQKNQELRMKLSASLAYEYDPGTPATALPVAQLRDDFGSGTHAHTNVKRDH